MKKPKNCVLCGEVPRVSTNCFDSNDLCYVACTTYGCLVSPLKRSVSAAIACWNDLCLWINLGKAAKGRHPDDAVMMNQQQAVIIEMKTKAGKLAGASRRALGILEIYLMTCDEHPTEAAVAIQDIGPAVEDEVRSALVEWEEVTDGKA